MLANRSVRFALIVGHSIFIILELIFHCAGIAHVVLQKHMPCGTFSKPIQQWRTCTEVSPTKSRKITDFF